MPSNNCEQHEHVQYSGERRVRCVEERALCEVCTEPIGSLPFYAAHVSCCASVDAAALESQEFYELMQVYRHAPVHDQAAVLTAFEAVKVFIRTSRDGES